VPSLAADQGRPMLVPRCRGSSAGGRWWLASLLHCTPSVSAELDTTQPPHHPDAVPSRAAHEAVYAALLAHAAATLQARSGDIAVRWDQQSRAVVPRDPTEPGGGSDIEVATHIIEALAGAMAAEEATTDGVIALGLGFGTSALSRGRSLPHTLKAVDLLTAMMLYSVETSLAEWPDAPAEAGVRLSRRLQQVTSLLNVAVAKGYTQAMGDVMRGRFRHLRHDLRNPLGTIKSVLAMMDDETMPAEARANPRFRAMAKRNARSLSELIANRLRDGEALVPGLIEQTVPLRAVASAVRRDLRTEADAKAVRVTIGRSPRASVAIDAVGLELVLREAVLAAIREASRGDEFTIDFSEVVDERITVLLTMSPQRQAISNPDALHRVVTVTKWMQGELTLESHGIAVRIPARSVEPSGATNEVASTVAIAVAADAAPGGSSSSSGRGEPHHDVGGPHEREHGQPGAL
jgi:signal transduction histidine kinase